MGNDAIDLTDDAQREKATTRQVHPWYAVRPRVLGRAAVLLALLRSAERFEEVDADPSKLRAAAGFDADAEPRILDVFAGTASIAGAAAELGLDAVALEQSPVAHLIARCVWELPKTYGQLERDVSAGAHEVWSGTRAAVAEYYRSTSEVAIWVEDGECPTCGGAVPLGDVARFVPGLAAREEDDRHRAVRTCPFCSQTTPLARLRTGRTGLRLAAVADGAELRTEHLELKADDARPLVERLSAFLKAPPLSLLEPGLGTQRQGALMLALLQELASLRRRWLQEGRDESRVTAAVDCLALCVSGTSLMARRNGRLRHRGGGTPYGFDLGLRVGDVSIRPIFAEPSLDQWQQSWQRRVGALLQRVDQAKGLRGSVYPTLGDAAALPFEDESFDAVVCDPPYFDNIQYVEEARPFYGWLRLLLADPHPELFGAVSLDDATEVAVRRSASDRAAELSRYERLLMQSVDEAVRVLREDRCLAFVFTAQGSEQLSAFLRRVQPRGLELVDAVRVARPPTVLNHGADLDERAGSYVLLFRKSRAVAVISDPSVDAKVVLDLATHGRSKLYAAVAEILEAEWDEETADESIPAEYRGTLTQKIQELVASHRDPAALLAELGSPTLRRHAARLNVEKADQPAGALGLGEAILGAVGFSVPSRPTSTFIGRQAELSKCVSGLLIASSLEDIRGQFLTGSAAVEQAIRVATVAWLQAVDGDAWLDTLRTLFEDVRDKPFRGPGAFAFGDWLAVFFVIPRLHDRAVGATRTRLAELKKALGKRKAQSNLERTVAVRNMVEHDTDGFLTLPLEQIRGTVIEGLQAGQAAMQTLIESGTWPQVLQPVDERRDRYNRLTLRALDERGGTVELFVDHPADLTTPLLWFKASTNPREVEPLLLSIRDVTQATERRV